MKINPLWPSVQNTPLVLDGDTVKLRLLAARSETSSLVHVDWVRFTVKVRNTPCPETETLFPEPDSVRWDNVHWERENLWEPKENIQRRLNMSLSDFSSTEFFYAAHAHKLAEQISEALGVAYSVDLEPKKGIDFYKYRWSILLNGSEVGWVGYLSSSDSPRQSKQSETVHANIMGAACTFAESGWRNRLADLIDECAGDVTRADLALDFFEGYQGGIDSVRQDYRDGLCNVGGRKLKFNMVGDWENEHDRSLYVGSREAGKITNVYEKGDQLYGHKANSDWLRFELRYGNKFRVLSSDILRRPDDFFAGASDWHTSVLIQAQGTFSEQKIPCKKQLEIQTISAECNRAFRWAVNTAGGTFGMLLKYLDQDKFWDSFGHAKLPGRLRKFSESQIAECFSSAVSKFSTAGNSPGFCVAV